MTQVKGTRKQFTLLEDKSGIRLKNGQIVREGDPVTVDPVSGRLWSSELSLLPPDQDVLLNFYNQRRSARPPSEVSFLG